MSAAVAARIDRRGVLAFRVHAQHLARRLAAGALEEAAWGSLQDAPPGAAALALAARVEDFRGGTLEEAVAARRLVRTWSVRGATAVFPAAALAAFTAGALPRDEAGLRAAVPGAARALAAHGVPVTDALARVAGEARRALDGRALTRDELHEELRRALPAELLPWCRGCTSHHVSGSLFRALGPAGVACTVGRSGRQAVHARLDQWLGRAVEVPDAAAEAELARRHLAWQGPSTAARLAAWAGMGVADGRRLLALVRDELLPVETDTGQEWLLAGDAGRLGAEPPRGVRLLGAGDPLLLARDRERLVPDEAIRRQLWRAVGGAGALLVDGEIAGTWRPRAAGGALTVAVEPAGPLSAAARAELGDEAERTAAGRGLRLAGVAVD